MRNAAMPKTQKNQQGVAAIEFALVIITLLVICFAIVSFGMLMWTQQKVSHIAGDSARVALQLSISGDSDYASKACAHANNLVTKDFVLNGIASNVICTPKPVDCPGDEEDAHTCLKVIMKITVDDKFPLINLIQTAALLVGKDEASWKPGILSAAAIVKITNVVKT
ncbi:pilus assembly protein [Advenella sp. WQ 585]|uniref:Pilus assembly protein n=1 Tax=Advenella mandrilli TaxID=2800330 RepID=A0ABS1E8J3_9BURK|nr:TadE family protein [Advenella mandrilli]MBK1779962.1 pilus assembly protein [Advenella mandrilli]